MPTTSSSEALQSDPSPSGREDQTMGRNRRLTLVASLYSTQNLCLAAYNYTFLIAAQKTGSSLEMIGAAAGLALIIVLKFVWAPSSTGLAGSGSVTTAAGSFCVIRP